jgi:hypothetical protein
LIILKKTKKLPDEVLIQMMQGIITFASLHDLKIGFGDNKEPRMTPDNAGILVFSLPCGCEIEFGMMDDGTYHLHSMIKVCNDDPNPKEINPKKILFEV